MKSIDLEKVVLEKEGKVLGIGEGNISGSMRISRKSEIPID